MHKVYEKDKCAYMFRVDKNKMIIDIQSHGAPKLNFVGSVCVKDFNCDVTAHALGGCLVNRKCCCSFRLLFQQVSMICSFYFCYDCGQCLRCTIYGFLLWSQTASGEVYTVQRLLQLRPKAPLVWNKMKKIIFRSWSAYRSSSSPKRKDGCRLEYRGHPLFENCYHCCFWYKKKHTERHFNIKAYFKSN